MADIQHISTALQNFVTTSHLQQSFSKHYIKEAWQEIIQKQMLEYAEVRFFKDGVLFLNISASVVKNEVMAHKKILINRLNLHLKDNIVKDIIF